MSNPKTIYADYQATAPVDPRVLEAMTPYWQGSFGNPHASDHIVGWRAAQTVEGAAASVAALIGADPDEMIFTSGATEANNLALLGLARRAPNSRHRLLVSAIEHKCVLAAARVLEQREGFAVENIPVDCKGFVDIDALASLLNERTLAVSIMAVNNEIGTLQDVPRIANLLAHWGVIFHCDAAQAPCAMDVSELAEHADLVSLSGHKIYGPQGIGALYIRRGLQEAVEPLIYGGGQQGGLRSGTVPMPLCVGMAAAIDILRQSEGAEERAALANRRDAFVCLVQASRFQIDVNGPTSDKRHPGNTNLRFHGFAAQDILGALQPHLAASTGAACTTGMSEPSHVLRAIGLSAAEAESSIRFSFGRFTTDDDITEAARLVVDTLESLASGGLGAEDSK